MTRMCVRTRPCHSYCACRLKRRPPCQLHTSRALPATKTGLRAIGVAYLRKIAAAYGLASDGLKGELVEALYAHSQELRSRPSGAVLQGAADTEEEGAVAARSGTPSLDATMGRDSGSEGEGIAELRWRAMQQLLMFASPRQPGAAWTVKALMRLRRDELQAVSQTLHIDAAQPKAALARAICDRLAALCELGEGARAAEDDEGEATADSKSGRRASGDESPAEPQVDVQPAGAGARTAMAPSSRGRLVSLGRTLGGGVEKAEAWLATRLRPAMMRNTTGLAVTWLGTSSGAPTAWRNNSSIALRAGEGADEAITLVDVGALLCVLVLS
jgi:hypothetical protein